MGRGRRDAVHARVLPGRAAAARGWRRPLPVGAHLRHPARRPSLDRGDVRVRVSARHDVARGRRRSAAHRSDRPLDAKLDELAARIKRPGVAANLQSVGVSDAASLLSLYIGGSGAAADVRRRRGGAVRRSDGARVLRARGPVRVRRHRQRGGAACTADRRGASAAGPRRHRSAVSRPLALARPRCTSRPRRTRWPTTRS